MDKLRAIDFDILSQECKVDYILFERDLNENMRQSQVQRHELDSESQWFSFSGTVYDLFKIRRRGVRPDSQKTAQEWSGIHV